MKRYLIVALTILTHHLPQWRRYSGREYHGFIGWGVMLVAIIIIWGIAILLKRSEPKPIIRQIDLQTGVA